MRPHVLPQRDEANRYLKLEDLGTPKLNIIGGKDCDGVTQTPKHEEVFKIGDISVKAIYTPCHTQDSICFFMEDATGKAVFTGDTLFIGGECNWSSILYHVRC